WADPGLLGVEETMGKLQTANVKIDPEKCAFEMEEGKFLGYVVAKVGIRADPESPSHITQFYVPKSRPAVKPVPAISEHQ
ncbi:hypothetical protein Tco_1117110, partial [Tanacetum coccineum]